MTKESVSQYPEGQREIQDAEFNAVIKQTQRQNLETFRNAFPEQAPEIDRIAYSLQHALYAYWARSESDPEVLSLVQELIRNLEHTSMFGDSEKPLSKSRENELKAGLIGAAMTLRPDRDRMKTEPQPMEHVKYVRKFLDLVKERVGHVTDPSSGEAQLRMIIDPKQTNWTIRYTKKQ